MRLFSAAATLLAASSAAALTPVKPYAVSLSADYEVLPLFSAGDLIPYTKDPARSYQVVGIPDGMGAHANADGSVTLYLNYELGQNVLAEPYPGRPLSRGAYVGRYIIEQDGTVVSAERAYETAWMGDTLVGPAAQTDNTTPGFARFCAGFLAGPPVGFDRWIYLAGEESEGAGTFDGKGGLGVAIYNDEAHALPRLGRFAKENLIVVPGTGKQTVIFVTEDGPSTPDSQLWMYVGQKDRRAGSSALRRNGLDNGKLYAFRSLDPARNSEGTLTAGGVAGEWVEIPGAENLTDVQLEAAADAVQAFGFVRIEDGAVNPEKKDEFFFVTTGSSYPVAASPWNKLGRAYQLKLDKKDPTGPAILQVVYNADTIFANGGDIAVSPDNIDVSSDYLVICEDGTGESRPQMSAKGRDGSIWRFPLRQGASWNERVDVANRDRIVELDPPGRDGIPVGPGVWETSGIIDATDTFGEGAWVFNVQAHGPTTRPAPNVVEDGQILLLRRRP